MENESIGKRGMGTNYKGSRGQTKRAVVLQEEEEEEEEEEIPKYRARILTIRP